MIDPRNNSDPESEPEQSGRAPLGPSRRPRPPDYDPGSVQIARFLGIPIRIHFTFLLVLVWIALAGNAAGIARTLIFVFGLFACVVLHELGHAITGLRYNVRTSSITLYPIGGIARMQDRPVPRAEFRIAIAGPAVNFAIAAVLSAIMLLRHDAAGVFDLSTPWTSSALVSLQRMNLMLGLFNLIPAFPMDGGRILRSLLAVAGLPIVRATNLAAQIGQLLAVLCGSFALFLPGGPYWFYILIAVFVYMSAGQEAQMVRQETVFTGVPLSDVMVTNVETLEPGASLREVADMLLHTSQQDFPVLLGDEVIGLMTRDRLLRCLSSKGPDAYVAGNMIREFNRAEPSRELSEIMRETANAGRTLGQTLPLIVMDRAGKLLGMVTSENLAEFFAIQQILQAKPQA
jgi:Zn-dependent protease/predicted transcriptional regulator